MSVRSAVFVGLAFLPASLSRAEDRPSLGAIANHAHTPIHVRSKPVIERLPVKVIDPVDLVLSDAGNIFVADRQANCVFRLDQHGSVSLMVEQLEGIERIAVDADESLYILTSTSGESLLHQVTPAGKHLILQTFAFPANAFVRDSVGRFVVAEKQTGRLVSFSPDGEGSAITQLKQSALDLTFNAGGQLEALLPSGHVVRIAPNGEVTASGFAEIGSSRLTALQDGTLLTLCAQPGRARVLHVSRNNERPDEFKILANVPVGTRSVGLDSLGNLCLANPDLRAITKVTSQFEIPCPHCSKPTRMIFSSEAGPAAGQDTRSF
jgi:hypothetical protein